MKLPLAYFQKEDVVELARATLGKVLCTNLNGVITKGVISETEAYNGIHDKACHAFGGKRTARTETMFLEGGHAYVYLCYGIHHLFNIVTGVKNNPTAILVRGIHPTEGIKYMETRRNKSVKQKSFSSGPGTASQALGISTEHDAIGLNSNTIWLEDHGIRPKTEEILVGPRIGVDYAGEDSQLPYRFVWVPKQGNYTTS